MVIVIKLYSTYQVIRITKNNGEKNYRIVLKEIAFTLIKIKYVKF